MDRVTVGTIAGMKRVLLAAVGGLAVAAVLSGCDNPDATIPRDGQFTTRITPQESVAPTDRADASAWSKRSNTALTVLQQQTKAMKFALGNEDWDAVAGICTQIGDAGRTLGESLPAPNTEINALLGDAVAQIASGEKICKGYGPGTTEDQTKKFNDTIDAAEAKLSASMHVW